MMILKQSALGKLEIEEMQQHPLTEEYINKLVKELKQLRNDNFLETVMRETYPTVTDDKTNRVYFSREIISYQCWKDLEPLLVQKSISYSFINGTRDLWVRDFMPVQIYDNKFIQFVYNPDYLRGKEQYLTDVKSCTLDLDYHVIDSEIVLDGGNVIKCDDCVLITDKVFLENKDLSPFKVVKKLQRLFETEVIIIPRDVHEECGHADGMLRYLGNNRLLLNHYVDFDKPLRDKLIKVLSSRFDITELHYQTDRFLSTSWAYLNYLQVGEYLFAPVFKNRLDNIALAQLEEFTGKEILPVYCKSTVKIGGGLNCLSWTVKHNEHK